LGHIFQRFDEKCDLQALSRQCMDCTGMIETVFAELQFHYHLEEIQKESRICLTPSSENWEKEQGLLTFWISLTRF
jgi:hypothetical protein